MSTICKFRKDFDNYQANGLWDYYNEHPRGRYPQELLEYVYSKNQLNILKNFSTRYNELEDEIVNKLFPDELKNIWFEIYPIYNEYKDKQIQERYEIMQAYINDKGFDYIKTILDMYIDTDKGSYKTVKYRKK
jgi:hypothetical protein